MSETNNTKTPTKPSISTLKSISSSNHSLNLTSLNYSRESLKLLRTRKFSKEKISKIYYLSEQRNRICSRISDNSHCFSVSAQCKGSIILQCGNASMDSLRVIILISPQLRRHCYCRMWHQWINMNLSVSLRSLNKNYWRICNLLRSLISIKWICYSQYIGMHIKVKEMK